MEGARRKCETWKSDQEFQNFLAKIENSLQDEKFVI